MVLEACASIAKVPHPSNMYAEADYYKDVKVGPMGMFAFPNGRNYPFTKVMKGGKELTFKLVSNVRALVLYFPTMVQWPKLVTCSLNEAQNLVQPPRIIIGQVKAAVQKLTGEEVDCEYNNHIYLNLTQSDDTVIKKLLLCHHEKHANHAETKVVLSVHVQHVNYSPFKGVKPRIKYMLDDVEVVDFSLPQEGQPANKSKSARRKALLKAPTLILPEADIQKVPVADVNQQPSGAPMESEEAMASVTPFRDEGA